MVVNKKRILALKRKKSIGYIKIIFNTYLSNDKQTKKYVTLHCEIKFDRIIISKNIWI